MLSESLIRRVIGLVSLTFFWALAATVSAEEVYSIGSGEEVRPLDSFKDCDVCPEMVVLPLGEFYMGSTVEEANEARKVYYATQDIAPSHFEEKVRQAFVALGIDPDDPENGLRQFYLTGTFDREDDPQYFANPFLHEVPRHRVLIDMPIAIGRHEITREEWAACVADGVCEQGQTDVAPDNFIACSRAADCAPTPDSRAWFRHQFYPQPKHPRMPQVGMTFAEMQEYLSWLNAKIGADVYRLPTEAEWEYAARAGTETPFAQGTELTLAEANFLIARIREVDGENVWVGDPESRYQLVTVDDLDAANDWGIRHMSGNATEVTSSCGEGPHKGLASSSDYLAVDLVREDCDLTNKGGMFVGNVALARPARRVAVAPDHWSPWTGFRVVRDLTVAE